MFLKKLFVVVFIFGINVCLNTARNQKHIVCYHGTWATYRESLGKFGVSDIDPFLCTHLMYAFFGIEESGELRVIDPYLDLEDNWGRANIKEFNALKLKNPTLKTLAAVGGWNEGSKKFSIVAANAEKRARFVESAVRFLQRHGFDGLDLDWEYPQQRHSLSVNDRENFVVLLRELHEGLKPFGYILTAAVGSAEFSASLSYDIPRIVPYLDLINVMAYDLHGPWDNAVGINAPLYAGESDKSVQDLQLNVDAIVNYWLSQGAPSDKLVIGVPFYGRTFTLEDAASYLPGSPHTGRGVAGQYSREPGMIGYNEICAKMQQENWALEWEPKQMVPYAHRDRQWVGFETPRSIALKAQYVMDHDLAGAMVWSVETDDFRGDCDAEKYPLLKQINRVFFGSNTTASGYITNSPTDVSKIATTNFQCTGQTGFVRDPYDCAKFYVCNGDITYNFECPPTLKFDVVSSSCNYEKLVAC